MANVQNSYTGTHSAPFTITAAEGISSFTILPSGGPCTLRGSGSLGTQNAGDIVIPDGVSFTVGNSSGGGVLDGWLITPSADVLIVANR